MDWTAKEKRVLRRLGSPPAIQEFLDAIPYNPGMTYRSPRQVLADRQANCMEGAAFAACCLDRIGLRPALVEFRAVRDDSHLVTIFRQGGRLGAISKSNFSGLRYRCPVYRTLRELVMSYFEHHFNVRRELTMRSYTRPLVLTDRVFPDWRWRDSDLDDIADALDRLPGTAVVDRTSVRRLRPVDDRLFRAGLLGADPEGLYRI